MVEILELYGYLEIHTINESLGIRELLFNAAPNPLGPNGVLLVEPVNNDEPDSAYQEIYFRLYDCMYGMVAALEKFHTMTHP